LIDRRGQCKSHTTTGQEKGFVLFQTWKYVFECFDQFIILLYVLTNQRVVLVRMHEVVEASEPSWLRNDHVRGCCKHQIRGIFIVKTRDAGGFGNPLPREALELMIAPEDLEDCTTRDVEMLLHQGLARATRNFHRLEIALRKWATASGFSGIVSMRQTKLIAGAREKSVGWGVAPHERLPIGAASEEAGNIGETHGERVSSAKVDCSERTT
jgi:hypothetical protein